MRALRLGTRESPLALRQVEAVVGLLRRVHPRLETAVSRYRASGDDRLDVAIPELPDDAFTDRLEAALREGGIDAAVHAYKDLPFRSSPDLVIAAIPLRADPREALVSHGGERLADLAPGSVIGTSSDRRIAHIRRLRPDCETRPIRGGVDARLRQVLNGEYDAAIFAAAGLIRLGLDQFISEVFDVETFPPAAGQGALAVQCRAADRRTVALLAKIDDPALRETVLGEYRREGPLAGRTVVVTRASDQARELCEELELRGARVIRLPLISIGTDPSPWHAADVGAHVSDSDWLVFTSVNGVVSAFSGASPRIRGLLRRHSRVAVIGPATAMAAQEHGLTVSRIADEYMAESLADALGDVRGQNVLWFRGAEARTVLASRLRARGASVTEWVVYRTSATEPDKASTADASRADYITLTSPSIARQFVAHAGIPASARIVCIGPVTAEAARQAGLDVHAVADKYTAAGLLDALVMDARATPSVHAHG